VAPAFPYFSTSSPHHQQLARQRYPLRSVLSSAIARPMFCDLLRRHVTFRLLGSVAIGVIAQSLHTIRAQPVDVVFEHYMRDVRAYRHKALDTPSDAITDLTKADFNRLRPLLVRREPADKQAAALLHTEAALVSSGAKRDQQLAFAEAVIRLLPQDIPSGRTFSLRWYQLVPTIYFSSKEPEPARPFIDAGLRQHPQDALLWLRSGIAYEMTGNLRSILCTGRDCQSQRRRAESVKWMDFAAREYRRALRQDIDLSEAQLRLGRVRALLGDGSGASENLDPVFRSAGSPEKRYLAALFSAGVALDNRDSQLARTHYQHALDICGGCQSALLGIAALDATNGDRTSAESAVEHLFELTTSLQQDPWLRYQYPSLDEVALNALRDEVRR
jgi:hypothetical protein